MQSKFSMLSCVVTIIADCRLIWAGAMIRWCWGGNRENRSPGGDGIGGRHFRFTDTYPMGIELEAGI